MPASIPDTRQAILDGALTVLQRDGASALTVRNVADEAGCSTTGIYTHFGDKNGLVEAIFLDGARSFATAMAPAYQRGDLTEAGRAYRRWALDNPTHYLVMFGRAVPDFEPSADTLTRAGATFQGLIDLVARVGADEPEDAAYHLWATVHGYVMLELVGMGPVDRADLDRLYDRGLAAATGALF
jgi:AcrR family transcriptional regulator